MQPKYWENITLLPTKVEQLEEFRKKFSGTYMFVKSAKLKEKKMIQIQDVDIGQARIYARDAQQDIDYSFLYDSEIELSYAFPSAKLLNIGNNVLYFSRHPARQYYKAPNNQNCSIYHILINTSYTLSQVLQEAYNPTYYSFETAFNLLKTGDYFGIAIDPQFALTLSPNLDDLYLLYYIDTVIGYVDKDSITLRNDVFMQEVEDFLYRNRISSWKIKHQIHIQN